MSKSSFVLYIEYLEHLNLISDDKDFRVLIESIFKYQIDGTIPEKLPSLSKMAFSFIKTKLDRDNKKYEEISRIRAAAGKKGGKQLQTNEAIANKPKQVPLSDNDSDSDSDSDINKKENIKRKSLDVPKPERLVNGKPLTFYYAKVPLMWNTIFAKNLNVPKVVKLGGTTSDVHKKMIKGRLNSEFRTLEEFGDYFDYIRESKFLTEECTAMCFEWVLRPSILLQIMGGKYHDSKMSFEDYLKFKEENNHD